MRTSDSVADINAAISKAQAILKNPPKNKFNPHFKSYYADLASVLETILPIFAGVGISITQSPYTNERGNWLITRLSKGGEWLESDYFVCGHQSQQKVAAEMTYAKRVILQAFCGVCGDDDDDGNSTLKADSKTAVKFITEEQVNELEDLITEVGADREAFLAYAAVKSIGQIKASDFKNAKAALLKKKKEPANEQ